MKIHRQYNTTFSNQRKIQGHTMISKENCEMGIKMPKIQR